MVYKLFPTMMWGGLATHSNIGIVLEEIPVHFNLVCFGNVRYFKLTGILAYFCNRECTIVRPPDEVNTPCRVLYRFYDFTLK